MSKRSLESAGLDMGSPVPVSQKPKIAASSPIQVASYGISNWSLQDSDRLFHFVLDRASQEQGSIPFKSFVESKTALVLLNLLRTSCADGLAIIDSGRIRDKELLIEGLPDDKPYHNGNSWYLFKLLDKEDDKYFKLVVGQTNKYVRRKGEYERARKNPNDSKRQLLHEVWSAKESRHAKFGILGTWKDDYAGWTKDDYRVWQNIVEMYFTVAFQSLPSMFNATVKAVGWVPIWLPKCPEVGLQSGLPIHQSNSGTRDSTNIHLWLKSDDPEVVRLYQEKNRKQLDEIRPLARQALEANEYQNAIASAQSRSTSVHAGKSWRFPDKSKGDPETVEVKCATCKTFVWTDRNPKFSEMDTGKVYVVSKLRQCSTCMVNGKMKNGTYFRPTDPNMKTVVLHKLQAAWKAQNPPQLPALSQAE